MAQRLIFVEVAINLRHTLKSLNLNLTFFNMSFLDYSIIEVFNQETAVKLVVFQL